MTSNSSNPWSPQYGTATFTTFSDTPTPLSPSRYSHSSHSDTQHISSDGDDNDSTNHMRRITVSPSPSQQNSDIDSYTDENSIDEVEATLNDLDDEIDHTEQALTEWSHGSSSGQSYASATGSGTFTSPGYTGYTGSPSYISLPSLTLRSAPTPPPADPRARLSKITEKTEESSRPGSGAFSAAGVSRPANPTPDALRRSVFLGGTPSHSRASTDSSADRTLPPPGRATELIAVFETNSPGGHSRAASAPGVRSSSPFYSTSYGYSSRPSSPSKSATSYTATDTRPTGSTLLSPPPRPSTSMSGDGTFRSATPGGSFSRTMGSSVTPTGYTTQTPRTEIGSYTGTETGTYTNTNTQTFTDTFTEANRSTTPTSTLRRPQTSPRSPLTSVRNIVALWKERTPSISRSPGKTSVPGSATSISPPHDEGGLFGIRRRAQRANEQLPQHETAQASSTSPFIPGRGVDPEYTNFRSSRATNIPLGLDVADLLPYTQSNEAPLHIGLLWYLNVHDAPPYRWQRCQALLYPNLLLLSWLSPGGGRGIVALDLLNCTSVQSAPSPTHPGARDDIGTIAARSQSIERDGQPLMDMLVPFHMMYADGVERLAAESLLERQRWVNRLWEAVNRPVAMPDSSSVTRSPTGSIRTITSIDSHTSTSSTGSRSTVYVPPLASIPSIPDFSSNASSTSSKSRGLSRRTSLVSSHHTHTVDDMVISHQEYVYPGDARAIQPARTGSLLRRSGSMTDLDAEFESALTRARGARPGLGFASMVFGGSPVTVSSGPTLGRSVVVTPPPSTGRRSDGVRSEVSDEQFFSAGSSGEGSRSSYYSQNSFSSELRTSTGFRTDGTSPNVDSSSATATQITPSTLSYRRTESASYLGDSHDSASYTATSPSRTPLSRTREVRRRGGRSSSRSYSSSNFTDTSDKENMSNSDTPEGSSRSLDTRSYSSSGSFSLQSRSYTESGSFASSGSYTESGSYTPSGSYTGSETFTPANSSETDYDFCPSSDLTDLTAHPITSSEDSLTPLSSTPISEHASDIDSENFITASQGSDDYLTARSPSLKGSIRSSVGSETSFQSFPTIPSESEYKTPDTGYSHYRTVSEPSADTQYISAELCPTIPSEQNTPTTLSSMKLRSEDGEESVIGLPSVPHSVIPSIHSLSTISDDLPPLPSSEPSLPYVHITPPPSISPVLPPLPLSESSLSPLLSMTTVTEESPDIPSVTPGSHTRTSSARSLSSDRSSSLPQLSASVSSLISDVTPTTLVLSSSPAPSEHPSTPAPHPPSLPSPTISSVSSLSDLTPAFSERAPPPVSSPQTWAQETDFSYESSLLAPSPSVMSLAVPEGVDTSFETSFLRPSGSGVSSIDRLSPIPETPTSLSMTLPRSPFPLLTPVPMLSPSVSSSAPTIPTPSSMSAVILPSQAIPQMTPMSPLSPSMASSSDIDTPSSLDVTTPGPLSISSPSLSMISSISISTPSTFRTGVATPSELIIADYRRTPLSSLPLLTPTSISSSDIRTPSEFSYIAPRLGRALSHVSVASFISQSSLDSSVLDVTSLLDEELESVEEQIEEPSTIPSLLTTPSQDQQLHPLPAPSTHLRTPEGSIIVSLSTPQGSAQTTRASLITQTSESASTERDLSRDLGRIVDDLRQYDNSRGIENRELADNVQALRNELRDLSNYLRRDPSLPRHSPAPQTQQVVEDVGQIGSPVMSILPGDHRGAQTLSRTHSTASSIGSFLSSHYSDDGLFDEQALHGSPIWHTPSIDESTSTWPDDSSGSPPYPDSSESSGIPPPTSPTPSTTSISTVRPFTIPQDLLHSLDAITRQVGALRDGQLSTNRMLNSLVEQPGPLDNTELTGRLGRIEELLHTLMDQRSRQGSYIAEEASWSGSESTGLSNLRNQLRNFSDEIPAPTPTQRDGPSLVQRLEEILAAGVDLPPPNIQAPPGFPNLIFTHREPRPSSPLSIQTLPPRSGSEPPLPWLPRRRPQPPRQPPHQPDNTTSPGPVHQAEIPIGPEVTQPSGERDIDIEREIRARRRQRFPGTDGTFSVGTGGPTTRVPDPGPTPGPIFTNLHDRRRSQTAPAGGNAPTRGGTWYPSVPRREGPEAGPPPAAPGNQGRLPEPRTQAERLPYRAMPPPPVVVQLPPIFNDMMNLLRQNNDQHGASVRQQQELMRYMHDLNHWLQNDTADRQDELRGLNARVDRLRQDILNIRVEVRPPESVRTSPTRHTTPLSESTSQDSPLGPVHPSFGLGGPPMPQPQPGFRRPEFQQGVIPPVMPDDHLPPGFVPFPPHMQPGIWRRPQDNAVIPPVIPPDEYLHSRHTPTPPFPPVIPNYPPTGAWTGPAPPIPQDPRLPGPMPAQQQTRPVEPPFIPPDRTPPRVVPLRYPQPQIIDERDSPTSTTTATVRSETSQDTPSSRSPSPRHGGRRHASRPSRSSRRSSSPTHHTIVVQGPPQQTQMAPSVQPAPVQPAPPLVIVPPSRHSSELSYADPHMQHPQQPAPIIIQQGPQPMTPYPQTPGMPVSQHGMPEMMMQPTVGVPGTQIIGVPGMQPTVMPYPGPHGGPMIVQPHSRSSSWSSRSSRSRSGRRRGRRHRHSRSPERVAPIMQPAPVIIQAPAPTSHRTRTRSRTRSRTPPPVQFVTQPQQAPTMMYPPTGVPVMGTGPFPMGQPQVVVAPRSRSSSRSSRRHHHRRDSPGPGPNIILPPTQQPQTLIQPMQPQVPMMQPSGIMMQPSGIMPMQPGFPMQPMGMGQPVIVRSHSSGSRSRSRSRSSRHSHGRAPVVVTGGIQPTTQPYRSRSHSHHRHSPPPAAPAPATVVIPPSQFPQSQGPLQPVMGMQPQRILMDPRSHRSHSHSPRSRSPRHWPHRRPHRYTSSSRSPSPRHGRHHPHHRAHDTSYGSTSPSPGYPRRRPRSPGYHDRGEHRGRSRSTLSDRGHGHRRSPSPRTHPHTSHRPRSYSPRPDPGHQPTLHGRPWPSQSRRPGSYSPRADPSRGPGSYSPRPSRRPGSYSPRPDPSHRPSRRPGSPHADPSHDRPSHQAEPYGPRPDPSHRPDVGHRPDPSHRLGSYSRSRPTPSYRSRSYSPRRPRSYSPRTHGPRPYRGPRSFSSGTGRSYSPRPGRSGHYPQYSSSLYSSRTRSRTPPGRSSRRPRDPRDQIGIHVQPPSAASHDTFAPHPVIPTIGRHPSGHRPQPASHEYDSDDDSTVTAVPAPSSRGHPSIRRPVHTPAPAILPPPHVPPHAPSHVPAAVHGLADGDHPLPIPIHSSGQRTPVHRRDTVTPLPGDLSEAERERDRSDRLHEVQRQVQDATHAMQQAEEQREDDFRRHEEDRARLFHEHEDQRHHEAQQHIENVFQQLHDRLAALPLPAPPTERPVPHTADVGVDGASVHTVQAASQHAIDILDVVNAEREAAARERETATREREILMEQAAMERQQLAEQQELRIKTLENELAEVRAELEGEKQQRSMMETEQRERESQAMQERDGAVRNQLEDITNLVQDQRDLCERKKEVQDQRWDEKQNRRIEKDQKMMDLEAMVRKLAEDMEQTRDLSLEAKISRERGPDLDDVIKNLQEQNAAQQALLNQLSQTWREDCARYHQETIASVQSTANTQVQFNVQAYLDEFSRALAAEVRMLLGEVGKLREERRGLQHELGYLLTLRSKYGPGGEFDPDWKPAPGGPGGPPHDGPPPEPPAPEPQPQAKPGWRKITPRKIPKPKNRGPPPQPAPAPPPPPPQPQPQHHQHQQPGPSTHQHMYRGPDPRTSWNTWQPDPNQQPSLPPTPAPAAHLLVPEPLERSPGLFGPRSPASSIHRG